MISWANSSNTYPRRQSCIRSVRNRKSLAVLLGFRRMKRLGYSTRTRTDSKIIIFLRVISSEIVASVLHVYTLSVVFSQAFQRAIYHPRSFDWHDGRNSLVRRLFLGKRCLNELRSHVWYIIADRSTATTRYHWHIHYGMRGGMKERENILRGWRGRDHRLVTVLTQFREQYNENECFSWRTISNWYRPHNLNFKSNSSNRLIASISHNNVTIN